ncbi:tRNA (N6-threonylcarbamoyladenosine(37)-N6)-methyltransferase TrmO [Mesorhizobium sp. CAU 1741]|uniref:tRNA (N6-threonylcarbamoyladenosine(37)-N6)-methyltransferase TrmO n=1 Tax=Mesorhizobium sp. CAU 1741 TaxID=3140366 RepID=UPI00325BAD60
MSINHTKREGEIELDVDPSETADDARLVFIGRIRSPWTERAACPKNMKAARETGQPATVEIGAEWRQGLAGLERASHIVLLTWLDQSQRNLIIQKPRHAETASGTFALRSPARPNPIGLHVVRLLRLDQAEGVLHIEAIDVLDKTPLIDIKPYYASTDAVAEAVIAPR